MGTAPDNNNGQDIDHRRDAALVSFNASAMNGFPLLPALSGNLAESLANTQLTSSNPYWTYADHFVLADNSYSSLFGPTFPNHLYTKSSETRPGVIMRSLFGPTFPNHLYTIAAQSAGAVDHPTTTIWGCDAKPVTRVRTIKGSNVFPCFSESQIETLASELDNAGVSWKFYAPTLTHYNPFEAIQEVRCGDPSCSTYSQEWLQHVDNDPIGIEKDVQAGQLPQVSWYSFAEAYSDHSPASLCKGETALTDIVNLIMDTALHPNKHPVNYWQNTAIIVTWDDFGGFYDHVPPLFIDQEGYGFRTPTLIISPYAYATSNPNHPHVTHTLYDFSSVVRLIETVFNLSPLDGRHDRDAFANNMIDAFNFNLSPIPPLIVPAPKCGAHVNLAAPPPPPKFINGDPD